MSDKLFILNKMFKYMNEIKQYTSFSFSGSPEYVDVFNDESTSLVSDNDIMLGALCALQDECSLQVCSLESISPTGETRYSIALGFGINVHTKYLDGSSVQSTTAATSSAWGRKIYVQYLGPNRYNALYSGHTYTFMQDVANVGVSYKNYYYLTTITTCGSSSCATTIENVLKTAKYEFKIASFDGHDVPCYFYLSGTGVGVKVTSGQSLSITTYPLPQFIYVSALTYNTAYTSEISSTAATEAIRNSKIGTKYTVTNAAGNKTATTISGGSYVYTTSCVRDTSTLMLIPTNPFFIQTSAQSITINYERLGSISSAQTYDLPSYTILDNILLPIQESDNRLATINDLSNTNGLGISVFNSMFNNATSNFKNIVITPNYYDSLVAANYNTSYKYYKPAIFFKAASTNDNYCLRMNDISTFDKWMYMVGAVSNSATTLTNNNFDYKNYDSANVKSNRDWASNFSDKNAYFTLILK